MQNRHQILRGCLAAATFAFLSFTVSAQTSNVQPRITAAINESQLTTLRGNTHPYARPQFDRGAAPDSLPMQRMLLVLKRSPAQESALDTLMEQQQDASSPNYHAWLTPQQFGQQFGPADADIQTIASWLESEGFTVNRVSNGRTVIEFSGTAGQVRDAFHTEIHRYNVNNEDHWANASDPQIPTALSPVVAGIDSLYNFPREAMHHVGSPVTRSKDTGKLQSSQPPLFTLGGECGVPGLGCYGVTPYDFAIIYDVLPLWNATPTATDGTGETIAIVAESDISIQDVRDFRSYFGLPAKDPQFIYDGPDPGTVPGDETESDLDVEWSGAVAKGATIDFVISGSTETSLGVDLSAEYIVDNNLAPILSESYGICELGLGTAGNQFYDQLWQQAAAQGITVLVSSGDSGSAGCDPHGAPPPSPAQFGLMVSGFESTPYNVSVGGTDFNDLTNPALFWSTTNSPPPSNPSLPPSVSARSYIPETTWNASCTNAVLGTLGYSTNAETNCNNDLIEGLLWTLGGSGGKSGCTTSDGQTPSSCAGGYAKPTWQAGTGVPADTKRDVPDVSLFSSINGPSGAFYLICAADLVQSGYTSCQTTDPDTVFIPVGGTSASAPAFAGIMALVDQKTGSRQGNANYVLYPLASKSGNRCTSAANQASTCVFYDVTNGTIAMPCATGSPNCNTSNPGDAFGVLSGYNTTTGYDLATGLGSVNAKNLVGAWTTAETALRSSSTALTLNNGSAVNITHGHSVSVGIGVTGTPGTPSGNVSLIANTGPDGTEGVQGFTLSSGSASGSTNALPGGTYNVFAQYAGDGTFASSNSATQSVTVAPEASKVSIAYELFDPSSGAITNLNATTAVFGTPSLLRVNATSQAGDACANNAAGSSGCPTGNVQLTDNGSSLDGGTFALNSLGYTEDQAIDLPGGTHTLGAKYNGDSSFNAPSPNPTTASLTITPVPTQTSFIPSGADDGTVGVSYTLEAWITSPNSIYSNIGPTGTVTFLLGTTTVGTATVSGSANQTAHNLSVYATTTTSSLPQGVDMITAKYSGDASYAASASSPTPVIVFYPVTVTISSSNSNVPYGTPVTYTAQVTTNQSGRPAITGSISFWAGGGLGTVTLSNGSAQLTSAALEGGVQNVIAYYSGDTNYEASSGSVTETVTRVGTTTAVSSSSSTIASGQSIMLTATISGGLSGLAQPSGFVQFLSNGTNIGQVYSTSGQAQLTTTALAAGTDLITAMYGGDTNYVGSTSSAITETVTGPPSFTVTANPTTIPVTAPGQPGSTTLTFTAQNGFSSNGAVTVTPMCSGLPSETTCSSGASITIPANGSAMATVTFQTTAPSAVVPASRDRLDIGGWRLTAGTLALACLLCAAMLAFGYREKRQRWGIALMFAVFALLAVSAGCGGGGGGNTGPPPNPGTPVGNHMGVSVSVTINGVTQTVSNLTLDVQ